MAFCTAALSILLNSNTFVTLMLTNLVVALPCDGAVQVAGHANSLDFWPDLHSDARLILCLGYHIINNMPALYRLSSSISVLLNV